MNIIKKLIAISVVVCFIICNIINVFAGGVDYDDKSINVKGGSLIFKTTDSASPETGLLKYSGYPTEFTVPDKVTLSGYNYYGGETFNDWEKDVTRIWNKAFVDSTCVKKVVIGENILTVGNFAFSNCPNLESFEIKGANTAIGTGAFLNCPKLIMICPVDSIAQKYCISNNIPYKNWSGGSVYYPEETKAPQEESEQQQQTEPEEESVPKAEYVYNAEDQIPNLPWQTLDTVVDTETAVAAVKEAAAAAGNTPTDEDYLTVFAEEAIARAATINIEDAKNIEINEEAIKSSASLADETAKQVLASSEKIGAGRKLRTTVRFKTNSDDDLTVVKSNIGNATDNIEVVTPYVRVSCNDDNVATMTFSKQENNKVKINFDEKSNIKGIKVNLPVSGDTTYKAVADEDNNILGGKYNPADSTISAKIKDSSVFSVVDNEKEFSDIKEKSAEMQNAIKLLASKGIISGTSTAEFSPDSSISRAEVAAIILRTLSELDENADGGFTDVSKSDWFYGVAGSSKNAGIINGYEDNTFRGKVVIPKDQIVSVSARVLKNEMGYYDVADVEKVLSVYGDSADISQWAKSDVALATDANMVIKRTDSLFGGKEEMTRGDAAIILKRLFDKVW